RGSESDAGSRAQRESRADSGLDPAALGSATGARRFESRKDGRPRGASALKLPLHRPHEFRESALAGAFQTLRRENAAQFGESLFEIGIHDHVIVFVPMAHFLAGFRHAAPDHGFGILRAAAQPAV